MLKIVYKPTCLLIPYVNNARTHSITQIKQIASSIQAFGFTNPILISNKNGIIAGHGRILAAELLKIKEVPTIKLDNLSEIQCQAYLIADNKLPENAGWNEELLKLEINDLLNNDFDLLLTGFDIDEISLLIDKQNNLGLTADDDIPELPKNPITQLGDIWMLNNHKLLCGDAINE